MKSFTLITIYMVAFTGFAGFSWLSVVTPYYFSSLGMGVANIGMIIAIYAYVNALGMLPSSMLAEKWGRRKFLITGLIISTVAPLLYPLTIDPLILCLIAVIHGLGSTLFIPSALAIVLELSDPAEIGKSIGWYSASAQLGLMAGPMAGGFILQQFGFVAAFCSCGFMPLLALILVLIRMRHISSGTGINPATGLFSWRWLYNRQAIFSMLALVMVAIGSSALNTFVPLYVLDFGINATGAGMIITACYASSATLRIPSGTLSDKYGNAPIVITGIILTACALALIASFNTFLPLLMTALLLGIGIGLSMPAALAWFAYSTPPEKRGLAMGLGSTSYQVGLAVGSTALGPIVQSSSYTFMYFCTSCLIGLSGIIIALSLLKKRAVSAG